MNIEFGKSHDTCRYTEVEMPAGAVTTTWYPVGSGVPVRIEDGEGFGSVGLRQGSVNGVPIRSAFTRPVNHRDEESLDAAIKTIYSPPLLQPLAFERTCSS